MKEFYLKHKTPFLSAMISGFAAFMYVFTNKLPNSDDLGYAFSKGEAMTNARWGLELCRFLFPDYSLSWIYGLISLLLLAAALCLIVELFDVRTPVLRAALPAVMLVFPSQIGIFAYMFTSSSYALAFLLTVLSVKWFTENCRRKKFAGLLALTFAVGIYQCYLMIAASLFVLLMVRDTLEGKLSVGAIIKKGLSYLAYMAIAGILYCLIFLLARELMGTDLGGYAENILGEEDYPLLKRFRACAAAVIGAFLPGKRFYFLVSSDFAAVLHLAGFALSFLVLCLSLKRKRFDALRVVFLFVLILIVLPLATSAMLLVTYSGVHTLVLHSFIAYYLLMVLLLEEAPEDIRRLGCYKKALALILAVITLGNVYEANVAYLKLHYEFEYMQTICTQVYTHLQMTPGFTEDAKVALMGDTPVTGTLDHFADMNITGIYGRDRREYFRRYLGIDFNFVSEEEAAALRADERFLSMPSYPAYGYVQRIGDVFVVKYGE